MNTLYLDIFSGISGDMFLGAMVDLGLDVGQFKQELKKLACDGYHLHIGKGIRSGIQGVKFDVHLESSSGHVHPSDAPQPPAESPATGHHHHHHHHHDESDEQAHEHDQSHEHGHHHEHDAGHAHAHAHAHSHEHHHDHGHDHDDSRNFIDIQAMIRSSQLSSWVQEKAISLFRRVAVAEGKIHGHPPEQVHFHEVGAVDSIVDMVGACIALEMFGKPRVLAAPVVEGTGWVNCAHGRFPVPTAATLEILGARGVPITQCDEPHELVTPTGAALLAEFVERFGPMEGLIARRVGYGLGTRHNKTRPNVLRAILSD